MRFIIRIFKSISFLEKGKDVGIFLNNLISRLDAAGPGCITSL